MVTDLDDFHPGDVLVEEGQLTQCIEDCHKVN